MKSWVAFFLTINILAQSLLPPASMELLRSPELWEHFREHQRQTTEPLSFWAFLQMHYTADSEHTKHKKHHLPSFNSGSTAGFFILPSACASFFDCPVFNFVEKTTFNWANSYSFLLTRALICPPRA